MQMDAPEKRAYSSYEKTEGIANINREADDELSAYTDSPYLKDRFHRWESWAL